MNKYIAVQGQTNTSGIGIVSIDHTDDTADIEFVCGDVVEPHTVKLEYNETGCYGFFHFGWFYDLSDFLRTN